MMLAAAVQEMWNRKLTNSKPASEYSSGGRKTIAIIFGLLILWGLLIALGAIVQADSFDIRKPLIVIGTMGTFLLVWLIALRSRNQRSHDTKPGGKVDRFD